MYVTGEKKLFKEITNTTWFASNVKTPGSVLIRQTKRTLYTL